MKIVLKVSGMHCSGCENRIKNSLEQLSCVNNVSANCNTGIVEVELSSEIDKNIVIEKIKDLGFLVEE